MKVARTRNELREALAPVWSSEASLGLVPTMGALHDGHLSLIGQARRDCDVAAISIFVNPAQFGPGEDLDAYPRDEGRDLDLARQAGVDLAYAPRASEVYPPEHSTFVEVEGLGEVLCGHREQRGSSHFRGVATVVCKLLNAFRPDRAYFGRKDAQQLAVIRRMVEDLELPVEVVAMPTVREGDGLAMSSRNAYLSGEERRRAAAIPSALRAGAAAAQTTGTAGAAVDAARRALDEAGIEPEYLEARDPDDLSPAGQLDGRPVMLAVAAQVGSARLIDNILIEPDEPSESQEPAWMTEPEGSAQTMEEEVPER